MQAEPNNLHCDGRTVLDPELSPVMLFTLSFLQVTPVAIQMALCLIHSPRHEKHFMSWKGILVLEPLI